jgi:hypothetical protein
MPRATRRAEYTGAAAPCLYLAFELGVDEWKLGFTTDPATKPRVRVMPPGTYAGWSRRSPMPGSGSG